MRKGLNLIVLVLIALVAVVLTLSRSSERVHKVRDRSSRQSLAKEPTPYERAKRDGLEILSNEPKHKAVVFDIDDTLLSTSKPLDMAPAKNRRDRTPLDDGFDEIPEVVALLRLAHQAGFYIVLLTARPHTSKQWTERNLRHLSIPYHELHFNTAKATFRRRWAQANSRQIALTIGDQFEDVRDCSRQGYHGVWLPGKGDPDTRYEVIKPEILAAPVTDSSS